MKESNSTLSQGYSPDIPLMHGVCELPKRAMMDIDDSIIIFLNIIIYLIFNTVFTEVFRAGFTR